MDICAALNATSTTSYYRSHFSKGGGGLAYNSFVGSRRHINTRYKTGQVV
jgi:hypothetical protein